jgi:hypothetical protein
MSKQPDGRQAAELAKLLREIADDPGLADTPVPDRLRSTIRGACSLACTFDPGSRVVMGSRVVTGYWSPAAPNVLSMTLREAHENLLRLLGALPRKGNEAARLRTLADGLDGGKAPARRHRRPPLTPKARPLTGRQCEVVQIVGECKGNLAEAAKRLGIDRKSLKESYDAAMEKLGRAGIPKSKTKRLPVDLRGQVAVTKDCRRATGV